MYRITLINMPFSNLSLPSLALTQLKAVLERDLDDQIRVRILYLNHDFSHYLGLDLYFRITHAVESNNSGLGDWLFRQVAFPLASDNIQQYFQRYYPQQEGGLDVLKGKILAKRVRLGQFLDRLIGNYQLDQEDLVGFTSMFAQNVASLAMARKIKDRNPRCVTVMGGANCEAPMGAELAAHVEAMDFIFSGPALVSFPQFVRYQIRGEVEACRTLQGVFCGANLGSKHLEGSGAIGAELPMNIPVPLDYDEFLALFEKNFPGGDLRPCLTFETSRGCWWGERSHCTFCGLNGGTMAFRRMPADDAVELLNGLFLRYGDRCPRYEAVDNIMPIDYIKDVFPRLKPPPEATIFYEIKANMKEEELEILKRGGVNEVQPGIESLSTSTLKLMRKGTTSFQNIRFLKGCLSANVRPIWNLLIGFPGEEAGVYEKYLADLPLLFHLMPPTGAFPVRFDRYSPYFTHSDSFRLKLSPYDFYEMVYPFGTDSLYNLAYYFEDRNYNARYIDNLILWKEKLNTVVDQWRALWKSDSVLPKPELYLKLAADSCPAVVFDSRNGQSGTEHEISDLGLRVLDLLHVRGMRLTDLERSVDATPDDLAGEIDGLRRSGILFEEDGRWMSLVIDRASQLGRMESYQSLPTLV